MTDKKQTLNRISLIFLMAGAAVFALCALTLVLTLGPLYQCVGDNVCPMDFGVTQLILGVVVLLMPIGFLTTIVSSIIYIRTRPRKEGDGNQS